ncbi:MAG: hypothetical protein FWE53_00465 [Firmicutes bacterium]|nr:hypothetical protein [Bacillota bacterium]
MLNDFENMLRNIENDRMMMSFGDNLAVVNSIRSIVSMVQSLGSFIRNDKVNDMFTFNVANKIMELESIVAMYGQQRITERGLHKSVGYGMQQPMPFMPNSPMMQQPMMPNMMYNANTMFAPQMPMQQPYMQPQMPQYVPPMQQPAYPAAPAPMPQYAPEPAAAPAPAPPAPAPAPAAPQPAAAAAKPAVDTSKPAGGPAAAFNLPGMGGGDGEKAAGRDYLLALLGEK